MVTINTYLQNKGFVLDEKLSNTKFSYYYIHKTRVKVDNQYDTVEINSQKVKIIKLIMFVANVEYRIAKSLAINFTPLIDAKISKRLYENVEPQTLNSLEFIIQEQTMHIAKLQAYLFMIKLNEDSFNSIGSWFIQTIKFPEFYKNDEYSREVEEALRIDNQCGTDLEVKYFPKLIKQRKKDISKTVKRNTAKAHSVLMKLKGKLK